MRFLCETAYLAAKHTLKRNCALRRALFLVKLYAYNNFVSRKDTPCTYKMEQ